MPAVLIEIIFMLFLAGSAVWLYISKTTKTVYDGVKERIRDHEERQIKESKDEMIKPKRQDAATLSSIKSTTMYRLERNGYYIFKHIGDATPLFFIFIFGERNVFFDAKNYPLSEQDRIELEYVRKTMKNDEHIFDNMKMQHITHYELQNNVLNFSMQSTTGFFSFTGVVKFRIIDAFTYFRDANGVTKHDQDKRLTFVEILP